MIKITNKEIGLAFTIYKPSLVPGIPAKTFIDSIRELDGLSVNDSMDIADLISDLRIKYITMQEQLKIIVDKHCKKDRKGVPINGKFENGDTNPNTVEIKDKDKFGKDNDELSDREVKIDFSPISRDSLKKVKNPPRPAVFENLSWLFEKKKKKK